MKAGEMIPSKYLKRSDVGPGKLFTIKGVQQEEVGKGDDTEIKWIMYFHESNKGMTLNKTNINRMTHIFGTDDVDAWVGKEIVLYDDPTIEMKGEIVGGIRVRAKKGTAAAEPIEPLPF